MSVRRGVLAAMACVSALAAGESPALGATREEVTLYPAPAGLEPSDRYMVRVTGRGGRGESFVYVSRCPRGKFKPDRIWRTLLDRTFSWSSFACTGPATVEVTKLFGGPAEGVVVSPKALGIEPELIGGRRARFVLPGALYVSVRFESPDNTDEYGQIRHGLMIFADPPEKGPPRPGDPGVVAYGPTSALDAARVIHFPPGVWDLADRFERGTLPIRDGQTVHLAPGAFVYGTIDGLRTVNTRVIGRGVISGARYGHKSIMGRARTTRQLITLDPWDGKTYRNVPDHGHLVEGVTAVDPAGHTLVTGRKSVVRRVKIIGWRANDDGMRNGDGSLIERCFVKTADDFFYAHKPITITRCVLWPMWNGATLQLGWGSYGGGGTRFVDNDIINPEWEARGPNQGFMASMVFPDSRNSDILVEDLRVEGTISALVNLHMRLPSDGGGSPEDSAAGNYAPGREGYVRKITLRNVTVENPQRYSRGRGGNTSAGPGRSLIAGLVHLGRTYYVSDVTFENLRIGGELVTERNAAEHFEIDLATTRNIRFIATDRRR